MKKPAKWLQFLLLSLAYSFFYSSLAESKPSDQSRWDEKYSTEKFELNNKFLCNKLDIGQEEINLI